MTLGDGVRSARDPEPTPASDAVAERLQGLLERRVSKNRVKHAVLGVEHGGGLFRWTGAAGASNPHGAPMRPDTPFFIASVTKLYIAAVVLQLHEGGQLDIDRPIATYLPQSTIGGLHRLGGVDYSDAITVRNLLGHTSGLPDFLEDRPKGARSLMDRLFRDGDVAWTFDEMIATVRHRLTPHFPPQPQDARRQKARYSDTNYQLLMAIIEAVAARPLHEVYEERLLRPLGLRHTYLPGRSRSLEPMPEPATIWFKERPLDLPLAMTSARDLVGTAEDTLRFLGALTRGDIFSDPTTAGLMRQRWNRIMFPLRYGLGMMRFHMPRALSPRYPVPEMFGHSGSTGSWLFHCPELDLLLSGTLDQASSPALPFRFLPRVLRQLRSITR